LKEKTGSRYDGGGGEGGEHEGEEGRTDFLAVSERRMERFAPARISAEQM
jgi:hypothetical protein